MIRGDVDRYREADPLSSMLTAQLMPTASPRR